MKDFQDMDFHPATEQVVNLLCEKTQSTNSLFFRVQATFHLTMIASQMRVMISTHDRGVIPVNMYALNLATSGAGKGFSSNILQNEITNQFREYFMENFDFAAEPHLDMLAARRAVRKGTEQADEMIAVKKEFAELGPAIYDFDDATPAAVKQARHKMLMANLGSINMIVDEVGSNLVGRQEVVSTFLELYDVGAIKQKLTKVTAENRRSEEIIGKTPTNLLMFGTPSKLLDGGKIEEELMSMLEVGYARRCFFSYGKESERDLTLTPEQVYDLMTKKTSTKFIQEFSTKLGNLADMQNMGTVLTMQKDVALAIIEYKLYCERVAASYPEHDEVRKAELAHRYFKCMKVAGTYAFIDGCPEITIGHWENAVRLTEDCGKAFELLLSREKSYVKLSKYIATCDQELTQPDLLNELPYYKGSQAQRNELMNLAIAYGYKNNIIIKRSFSNGVEFIRGETLKKTDLSQMIMSYTKNHDMTTGYSNGRFEWDKLALLGKANGIHWLNHHVRGGYRNEESAEPGFNMIVLDIDGTMSLKTAKVLLKGQMAAFYMTKSSTPEVNRFRIIMPCNYELKLDRKEYSDFMKGVMESLPFEVDESCAHRCKKWMSFDNHYEVQDGELFDVLPYIPKTQMNTERVQKLETQQQMDNMERWFINNTGDGNRNNMVLRFGTILVDAGYDMASVMDRVRAFNDKLPDKLEDMEIMTTVMKTVQNRILQRDAA